jgi:hypothetical protein
MHIPKIIRWGMLAASIVSVPVAIVSLGGGNAQAATSDGTCGYQACIYLHSNYGDLTAMPTRITYTDLSNNPQRIDEDDGDILPVLVNKNQCTTGDTCTFLGWTWNKTPSIGLYAELNSTVSAKKEVTSGTLIEDVDTLSFLSVSDNKATVNAPPYYPSCMDYAVVADPPQPSQRYFFYYTSETGWIQASSRNTQVKYCNGLGAA